MRITSQAIRAGLGRRHKQIRTGTLVHLLFLGLDMDYGLEDGKDCGKLL
jgi:hypothetical protein